MRANINGISLQGTPEELAKYSWEMLDRQSKIKKYGKEAQRALFDRQEAEMWSNA